MSGRRNCINNSSFSYTGKEQSPLRFGLSAEGYPVNSILEGFDKNIWVVEIKNNRKIWIRKDEDFRITYEQPLINKLEDYNKTVENINEDINDIVDDTINKDINVTKITKITKITKSTKVAKSTKSTKSNDDSNGTDDIANVEINSTDSTNTEDKALKKPTNYNIFLTYRLKMLKEEYKREGKDNKDKEIFKQVIKEWNEYKSKPAELKIILEEALSNT
jgi:hypothetical protein